MPFARAIETGSSFDTSDPGTPTWGYVGSLNDGGGVYLGDYNGTNWVLTASHVGSGEFTLDGTTYDPIGGSAITLTNGDGSLTDLTLFQISGTPDLPNLALAGQDQAPGSAVQMIGFGGGMSWGDNTLFGYTTYTLMGTAYGGMGIITLASGENGDGAQGVPGDSGGGMFYQTGGGAWVLSGILSGAGDLMEGSTDLGQATVAMDVATYSSQIEGVIDPTEIPEPTAGAVLLGLAALVAAFMRRRPVLVPGA
jgi:hypothetical protein